MKNCCTPTFGEFFNMMRSSRLSVKPVMKCKKHNKNVYISRKSYAKIRHLSVFFRLSLTLFVFSFFFYFIGGLKTLPIAIVGTLGFVVYMIINYSFYKKTCKNKDYYHVSSDLWSIGEFGYMRIKNKKEE